MSASLFDIISIISTAISECKLSFENLHFTLFSSIDSLFNVCVSCFVKLAFEFYFWGCVWNLLYVPLLLFHRRLLILIALLHFAFFIFVQPINNFYITESSLMISIPSEFRALHGHLNCLFRALIRYDQFR